MREIMDELLFRGFHPDKDGEETVIIDGKKTKGTWYYGDLLRDFTSGIFAIVIYVNLGGDIQDLSEINIFKVIPETVGRATFLTDKNGKKIFEEDILEGHFDKDFPENITLVEVIWKEFGFYTKEGSAGADPLEEADGEIYEVIGNIYDNPSCWKAV